MASRFACGRIRSRIGRRISLGWVVRQQSHMYVEEFGADGKDPTFTRPKDLMAKIQLTQWMEQDWSSLL